MPVVFNPTYRPTSGYRPVEWVLSATTPAADPVEFAIVEVFFDGVKVADLQKAPFSAVSGGAVITYGFRIDVQEIFQNLKAPRPDGVNIRSTIFGDLGAAYAADNPDFYADVNLSVTYLFRDSTTGKLTDLGITDVTLATPTYVLARQHQEDQAVSPTYTPDPLNLAPSKFLTNAPSVQDICLTESLFISVIHGLANAVRVQTFDGLNGSGALIDEGIINMPATGVNSQNTFGIGPNEIRATTFASGSVNIDNASVKSYCVTVGTFSPFIQLTETKCFNIVDCCEERSTRLHWLNLLGGADAYTFKSLKNIALETRSSAAQKPLNWDFAAASPHNVSDKGRFKIDSQATERYSIESKFLEPEVSFWLSELLSSDETYLEEGGELVPVTIADVTQDLVNSETGGVQLVRFTIEVIKSNDRVVQRS